MVGCVAVLGVAGQAHGQTVIYSEGGTQKQLQQAVDAVVGPGVVVIPAGSWELLGTVRPKTDDLTIIGTGQSHTLFTRSAPAAGLTSEQRKPYLVPFFQCVDNKGFRVSSLSITSWKATKGSEDLDIGIQLNTAKDFRVDNCAFRYTGNSGVTVGGDSTGVVDHCVFRDIFEPPIANYGYGVSVYGTTTQGEPFGTARAIFIEDNHLYGCRHAVASNRAARYVFRHNVIRQNTFSHAVDTHGAEYPPSPKPNCPPCYTPDPNNPGTEWAVVHDNIIEQPTADGKTNAIMLRGGKGLIYRNKIRGYTNAISLTKHTPQATGPVSIWGNDVAAPTVLLTTSGTCCGGSPVSNTTAPSDYKEYQYPHPLVARVVANAGPDQRVMLKQGQTLAPVYVDGTTSKVSSGSFASVSWHVSSPVASKCWRDVISMPAGKHTLLLTTKTDSGKYHYDTALVHVVPYGPLVSTPTWQNLWFVPFTETGTISFRIKPSKALTDAYVGFAERSVVSSHDHHAMQLRLNNKGFFDVRNAAQYKADAAIPYEPSKTYTVRVDFNISTQRYDVKIDGKLLAKGYAFRSSHKQIAQITAWNFADLGSFELTDWQMDGKRAEPDAPCKMEVPDAGPDVGPDAPLQTDGQVDAPSDGGIDVADATHADVSIPDVSADDAAVDEAGRDAAGQSDTALAVDSGADVSGGGESEDEGSGSCACRIGDIGASGSTGLGWFAVLSGFVLGMIHRRKKRGR